MSIPHELLAMITRHLDPSRGPVVVDDAIGLWHALTNRFRPLLGPLSTELLLVRALETSEAAFPWLQCAHERDIARPPFDALRRCLVQRTPEEIADANRAICIAFIERLIGLIGVHLATRFLRAAFPGSEIEGNQQGGTA
jgi:hypothetical protein